jgi:hypothetical protein
MEPKTEENSDENEFEDIDEEEIEKTEQTDDLRFKIV